MKAGDIAAAQDKLAAVRDLPTAEARANCRWLSGLCDGAHSRDGAGWSRWDREMGTRLAGLPEAQWGPVDLDHGRRLSHKYRKQLASRPSLDDLVSDTAAMVQRLTGADSVEVIDADAMPETESRAALKRIMAAPDPIAAAAEEGATVHVSRRGTKSVQKQGSREQPTATPAGESPADGPSASASGITLDDSQRAALDLIRRSSVAILTGGPGTGKTTLVRHLVTEALTAGHRIAAMAPTGIAAKRLAESIDFSASTIHRALGAVPHGDGVITVQPDALEATAAADLVIVDEMSMVDSHLYRALLAAIGRRARLLLIGDPDQLAPVGDGQPFTDIIDSGQFPVARLTTVHRQAEGSRIREACDLVRAGRWYDAAPQPNRAADLVWLEEESEELLADLCEDVLAGARDRYTAAEVTLLTPRVTGGTAGNVQLRTEELNRRLQRRFNPDAAALGGSVGAGDPVVCVKNRKDDDVWNGTGGVAVMEGGKLQLRTHEAEPRTVDCLEDCELAYAMSVHKYQGSQNRVIILAAHPSGGKTLTRRLLYTAISRAQERCILLGPREAFEAAVGEVTARHTLLRGLLEGKPIVETFPRPVPPPLPAVPRRSLDVAVLLEALREARRDGGMRPDFDIEDDGLPSVTADSSFAREIDQETTSTASGPRIVIGQPGRGKVAAALGI